MLVVMLAMPSLAIARVHRAQLLSSRELADLPSEPLTRKTPVRRSPNIYYFILDGYNHNDILKTYFGLDNSGLSNRLNQWGFFEATDALANYSITKLAIPAVLEMDYLFTSDNIERWWDVENNLPSLTAPTLKTRALRALYQRGYEIVFANHIGEPRTSGGIRFIAGESQGFSELTIEIVKLTPLFELLGYLNMKLPGLRYRFLQNPVSVYDALPARSGPRLTFAHILSPHPPFSYNADCSRRHDFSFVFNPEDFNRFIRLNYEQGTEHLYLDPIRCLNTRLEYVVGKLIQEDPEAIIVLQADHGFGRNLKGSLLRSLTQTQLQLIRFSIPNFIRMPGSDIRVPSSISPVNTFRLIIAHIDGYSEPDLLPDRSFQFEHVRDNMAFIPEVLREE